MCPDMCMYTSEYLSDTSICIGLEIKYLIEVASYRLKK